MSNLDNLTIGEVKEISEFMSTTNSKKSKMIGKICLVRADSAGVHFGEVVEKDGTNVLLKNSRRIRTWEGAFTLNEIAVNGVGSGSHISCSVDLIELTEAIELIPLTDKSINILSKIHE